MYINDVDTRLLHGQFSQVVNPTLTSCTNSNSSKCSKSSAYTIETTPRTNVELGKTLYVSNS